MKVQSYLAQMFLRFVTVLMIVIFAAGCASIEPWVQPYERENLADPIMSMNRNPVAMSYTHHAFQAREGARGAEGGAGGGCGCN
ncbi:DUF4266 domain-containing protein [Paraglaciecola sp. 25GB23A]|uniref:DUF4266 domain-containing protein n=1 Tax=Paraglaciecola sp. 25GB23A TaxID=3156068 RepID=UPI0032AF6895